MDRTANAGNTSGLVADDDLQTSLWDSNLNKDNQINATRIQASNIIPYTTYIDLCDISNIWLQSPALCSHHTITNFVLYTFFKK